MVNVIENSENKNQAFFRIQSYSNTDKSIYNYVFEEWINKDRTVRELIHIISVVYGLNVNSFYLILKSYNTENIPETKIKDEVFAP